MPADRENRRSAQSSGTLRGEDDLAGVAVGEDAAVGLGRLVEGERQVDARGDRAVR
jgi:hypothetical protein